MSVPRTRVSKVEVVEFSDPHVLEAQPHKSLSKKRLRDDDEIERNRRKAWSDVMELGAQNLGKREKKAYDIKKLTELGCKAPKNDKVPLKILFSMKKTHAKRAKLKLEESIASGVVSSESNKKKRKSGASKAPRRDDDIHYNALGSFRNGMLKLRNTNFA